MISWLLPMSAMFPLILAAFTALPSLRKYSLRLLPPASLPALAAALLVPDGTVFDLPQMLMGAGWRMDLTGRVFLLFTAFGWLCAALYAVPYLKGHSRRASFALPFLLAMSGNLLLPTAADAVTFYTGFAIMGFAAWGLIVHSATPEAFRAGRIYLGIVLLGEFLVLPGLIQGSLSAGSPSLEAIKNHWSSDPASQVALALIAIGFGLKAGLFPLHIWLPLAHPAAPAPASAVLSGCMIKTGLLAWLRLLPFGTLSFPGLGLSLALLAAAGMIGGLLAALLQSEPKALLAYTSLSKIGLMLLLLAAALTEPRLAAPCITAVLFLATFHALHKGALFLGTAITPSMGRAGTVLLILLAASYSGVPFMAGALAKDFIKAILDPALRPWQETLPLLLLAEALLAPAVMFRFVRMTRTNPSAVGKQNPGCEAIWTLAVFAALLLPWILSAADTFRFAIPQPVLKSFILGDPGFWIGAVLTTLMFTAGIKAAIHLPPGDWLHLLPSPTPFWRTQATLILNRIEKSLSHAPGGVAFLSVLLILLALLLF